MGRTSYPPEKYNNLNRVSKECIWWVGQVVTDQKLAQHLDLMRREILSFMELLVIAVFFLITLCGFDRAD